MILKRTIVIEISKKIIIHFVVLLNLFFVFVFFYTQVDLGVNSAMNFSYFIIVFGSLGSFILCQIKAMSSSFRSMKKNFLNITLKSSMETYPSSSLSKTPNTSLKSDCFWSFVLTCSILS